MSSQILFGIDILESSSYLMDMLSISFDPIAFQTGNINSGPFLLSRVGRACILSIMFWRPEYLRELIGTGH